jgi:stage IV sporulation protein A
VLPSIANEHDKQRAIDELPQSAGGKTIMTTEPKFIPKEAVRVRLLGNNDVKIRLIDCVGYIVKGAGGLTEDGQERQVMTPWSSSPMPFTKAAEYGTRKVIHDHSTIGVVVTTDGSFGELERADYIEAESRTIEELKSIGKAFVVLVNSARPFSEDARNVVSELKEKYDVEAMAVNASQLGTKDIVTIMETILKSFPVTQIAFSIPKWVEVLPNSHVLKQELLEKVRYILESVTKISDIIPERFQTDSENIKEFRIKKIGMEDGKIQVDTLFEDGKYYEILSELVGTDIQGEYQLIRLLREYSSRKEEIGKIGEAWQEVHQKGYGVVTPTIREISIDEPELIHHGNKYGVKLKALSPSIHLIQANIETEIAPIVGTREQAQDLIEYITTQGSNNPDGIWDTNIFGKTVGQLVEEGMNSKVNKLTQESQQKLQETIQKVINDSNGGLVCIII